jgi:hypothetical protein
MTASVLRDIKEMPSIIINFQNFMLCVVGSTLSRYITLTVQKILMRLWTVLLNV